MRKLRLPLDGLPLLLALTAVVSVMIAGGVDLGRQLHGPGHWSLVSILGDLIVLLGCLISAWSLVRRSHATDRGLSGHAGDQG